MNIILAPEREGELEIFLLGKIFFLGRGVFVRPKSRVYIQNTLPKTSRAPENRPSQKETSILTRHFFRVYVTLQACRCSVFFYPNTKGCNLKS